MRTQLNERLAKLKEELSKGESMMADLRAREANLKESMLRIRGAIQVLEEELAKDSPSLSQEYNSNTKEEG